MEIVASPLQSTEHPTACEPRNMLIVTRDGMYALEPPSTGTLLGVVSGPAWPVDGEDVVDADEAGEVDNAVAGADVDVVAAGADDDAASGWPIADDHTIATITGITATSSTFLRRWRMVRPSSISHCACAFESE